MDLLLLVERLQPQAHRLHWRGQRRLLLQAAGEPLRLRPRRLGRGRVAVPGTEERRERAVREPLWGRQRAVTEPPEPPEPPESRYRAVEPVRGLCLQLPVGLPVGVPVLLPLRCLLVAFGQVVPTHELGEVHPAVLSQPSESR